MFKSKLLLNATVICALYVKSKLFLFTLLAYCTPMMADSVNNISNNTFF